MPDLDVYEPLKSLSTALGSTTAVICHDAGSANIIQAWITAMPEHDWRPFMGGPAATSWDQLGLGAELNPTIDSALAEADCLLSGTGWESDLEHIGRLAARQLGIRNIAVLDHWVNYPDRFRRQGDLILPDEIFVTDNYAKHEAASCFPNLPVRVYENLYLKNQLRRIDKVNRETEDVLYLLEPIRAGWPRRIAGEIEALEFFIERWKKLGIPKQALMRLRPHPSDPEGKYDEWLESHSDMNVQLDDSTTLAESLNRSRWVAGCETFALTIALAAGRTVISTLPPWAPACRIPQEGIIHLCKLS